MTRENNFFPDHSSSSGSSSSSILKTPSPDSEPPIKKSKSSSCKSLSSRGHKSKLISSSKSSDGSLKQVKKNNQSENQDHLYSDPAILEIMSSVSSFKNQSSTIDPEPSISNTQLTSSCISSSNSEADPE